jgi:hypothetical protein
MLYAYYIIFHPFDGFWDMKHEKRGSAGAAATYLVVTCLAYIFMGVAQGYIINPWGGYRDFVGESLAIIMPLTLWVVSNWCLTTLFDGEGSMKDVFMVSCYALAPLAPIIIVGTLLTNVLVMEEIAILQMFYSVIYAWVGLLLFFGSMVIHDYTLGKNVATVLGSVIGMAFIMFIGVLFSALLFKIVSFVNAIYIELSYRF